MLTPEQLQSNLDLDKRIREAELQDEICLIEMQIKRDEFYRKNPDTCIKTLFIPILPKKFVGGIRYIDTP